MQSYSDLCAPQLFFDRKQWMVPLGIIHVKDGESQGQLTKVVPKKKNTEQLHTQNVWNKLEGSVPGLEAPGVHGALSWLYKGCCSMPPLRTRGLI